MSADFKRSRYWMGREEFGANDVASYERISIQRARQLIWDWNDELDKLPKKQGYTRYRRRDIYRLLRRKWV